MTVKMVGHVWERDADTLIRMCARAYRQILYGQHLYYARLVLPRYKVRKCYMRKIYRYREKARRRYRV